MTFDGSTTHIHEKESSRFSRSGFWYGIALSFLLILMAWPSRAAAQASSVISGVVTDASGAAVSGADVTAKDVETGVVRSAVTNDAGHYEVLALGVGGYEITVMKAGFSAAVHSGVHLAVGQEAVVNFALQVGQIQEQVTVTGDAPIVGTTALDASGLIGEQQIKELPLNGRSYDLLMTLDPGVVNYTAEKTGGIGISNSTLANEFAVAGNRPQQNLFLLNGIEYTGAAENNMQPGGTSGELLGVDAVREFNVLLYDYPAEYGKRPGGQVSIVTQSGSNSWHGTAFEFLRNNVLNEPNYFDVGSAPPFHRNQFGASLGGPVQKDKTFVFASYEGFRQAFDQTAVAFVPDAASRVSAVSSVQPLLNLWPAPPSTCVAPACDELGGGIAGLVVSPPQSIREDFGTVRLDHTFSPQDSFAAIYTIDDSGDTTASPVNPYTTDFETLREQVLSAEETHVFSPDLLNTARVGFSRAAYFYTVFPTPGTPAAANEAAEQLVAGHLPGAVVVGGSSASNPEAVIGQSGNNGVNLFINRNLFTYKDDVSLIKGRHQFRVGVWFQRLQSNEQLALSQFGNASFTSLATFLSGTIATFTYDPTPTPMAWRMLMGSWYAEDVIRLGSKLTLTLGFRDEFSGGWNEANNRAANFVFASGIIQTSPQVANSAFTINRAKFLPQPRIGVAWSPLRKTVIRAGFGMFNDLQDALGYRLDQDAPFNPTYSVKNVLVSSLPISGVAVGAKVLPAGVQPDLYTPTVISYSLRIERELSPNTSLSVGYVGNHGYHEIVSVDENAPAPVVCPASPCPAVFPAGFQGLTGTAVPAGTLYGPTSALPNPALGPTWTWMSAGDSSYNALVVDVTRRFNMGLTFRGVYTWSKTLDDGDSLNSTAANNAPGLVSVPSMISQDWGPATFDVRNAAVISASYALPFGNGKQLLGNASGWENTMVSGWNVNSIVTLQSGFPYTPQLSYNPSNDGDTKNPVRPFLNPNPGPAPVVPGNLVPWFNPNDFIAQPSTSNFYGNIARDSYTGPGLANWDFSAIKDTQLHENLNLQFRAEIFNMLNRANFNTPNLLVGTPSGVSATGGLINSTATFSRQIQFGLKLLW